MCREGVPLRLITSEVHIEEPEMASYESFAQFTNLACAEMPGLLRFARNDRSFSCANVSL
jgi:hypothetical protein